MASTLASPLRVGLGGLSRVTSCRVSSRSLSVARSRLQASASPTSTSTWTAAAGIVALAGSAWALAPGSRFADAEAAPSEAASAKVPEVNPTKTSESTAETSKVADVSPFVYPELVAGIEVRDAREREMLNLRAKARNRIFLLQERLNRREISERDFRMEMHKLKEAVNREAQQLIFGVAPDQAHARDEYLREYGCVKWSDEAMKKIAALGPLVEMGAGYGQWKNELANTYKVDIIAYDDYSQLYLPSEKDKEQTGVLEGNQDVLRKHSDRTLLLVAPPPTDMASKCLSKFKGKHLVYVGEGRGGAHADKSFFDTLESRWEVVDIVDVVPFSECYEKCFILERKPQGWFSYLWGG